MIIIIVTREPEALKELQEILIQKGHIVTLITSRFYFFKVLESNNPKRIDLIIADIRCFDIVGENIYKRLMDENRPIPFIYYNDPFPRPCLRPDHWVFRLKRNYKDMDFDTQFFYFNFFRELNDYFEEHETTLTAIQIKDEILSKAPPTSSQVRYVYKSKQPLRIAGFDPKAFQQKHNIPHSRFKLFNFMYNNLNKSVSLEDACINLWGESNEKKKKNLYTYIHDLKETFKKETEYQISIARIEKEKYCLIFQNQKYTSQ